MHQYNWSLKIAPMQKHNVSHLLVHDLQRSLCTSLPLISSKTFHILWQTGTAILIRWGRLLQKHGQPTLSSEPQPKQNFLLLSAMYLRCYLKRDTQYPLPLDTSDEWELLWPRWREQNKSYIKTAECQHLFVCIRICSWTLQNCSKDQDSLLQGNPGILRLSREWYVFDIQ